MANNFVFHHCLQNKVPLAYQDKPISSIFNFLVISVIITNLILLITTKFEALQNPIKSYLILYFHVQLKNIQPCLILRTDLSREMFINTGPCRLSLQHALTHSLSFSLSIPIPPSLPSPFSVLPLVFQSPAKVSAIGRRSS